MTLLLALYPRAWRDRYEDEFIALLEARPPDAHDSFDIVRGASDARLHPRSDGAASIEPPLPIPYNGPWSVHRAGQLTLLGGILYLAALVFAINGPMVYGDPPYRDGSAGFFPFFLSILLLLSGVWAVAATLPRTSRVARAAAVVSAICGILWSVGPWMLQFGGVMCLAIAILAIESARTRRWRWSDTTFLIGGVTAAVGVAVVAIGGLAPSVSALPIHTPDLQFVLLLLVSPLWFATAHALLRPSMPIADPVAQSSAA